MRTINLEEILKNNLNPFETLMLGTVLKKEILLAMKEAVETAIDICAENADADYTCLSQCMKEDIEVYVITSSILDVKKLIV
jgi:hypothetical protein